MALLVPVVGQTLICPTEHMRIPLPTQRLHVYHHCIHYQRSTAPGYCSSRKHMLCANQLDLSPLRKGLLAGLGLLFLLESTHQELICVQPLVDRGVNAYSLLPAEAVPRPTGHALLKSLVRQIIDHLLHHHLLSHLKGKLLHLAAAESCRAAAGHVGPAFKAAGGVREGLLGRSGRFGVTSRPEGHLGAY